MGPETILYAVGGVGVLGALFIILPKLLGRSTEKKLLDKFNKEAVEQKLDTEIKEITKEQKVIEAQIKASENASEETKAKIQKKLQQTAVEIQKTLKEDNLAAIDEQIDKDWGDL